MREVLDICTVEDDFVFEKPQRILHLSNGLQVISDDDRPGVFPSSSWERLKEFLVSHPVVINRFEVRFRSHREFFLPDNSPAYFFCKGAFGSLASKVEKEMWSIGWVDLAGNLHSKMLFVPELIVYQEDIRDFKDVDSSCIIWN